VLPELGRALQRCALATQGLQRPGRGRRGVPDRRVTLKRGRCIEQLQGLWKRIWTQFSQSPGSRGISSFEKYLTLWVALCIGAGIALGKIAPNLAATLDGMAIYVGDAPVVSIPIAICLFFMMYPIMVKIDFGEVIRAGKSGKPVGLTLFLNRAIKPFTMYAIALFFLGTAFYAFGSQYIRRYGLYASRTKGKWPEMPHVVRLAPAGWKAKRPQASESIQSCYEEAAVSDQESRSTCRRCPLG
jgi:hypothetical protein